MSKVKELTIDSTLWAKPAKFVNLHDFKPNKISIIIENDTKNGIIIHNVRYENGGFYVTIDNLEGYFDFTDNNGALSLLFINNDQKNKYYQVWKEIFKIFNGGHVILKSWKDIRLFDNDLPVGYILKINSITLVIKSLIEKNNKFYPEIPLNHCLYEIKEQK